MADDVEALAAEMLDGMTCWHCNGRENCSCRRAGAALRDLSAALAECRAQRDAARAEALREAEEVVEAELREFQRAGVREGSAALVCALKAIAALRAAKGEGA